MNTVKKIIRGDDDYKKKFKSTQQEYEIHKKIEERTKSANKREYERYLKEQEEAEIKKRLEVIRKKQNKEHWSSKHSPLKSDYNILKDERPILKERNVITTTKNIPFLSTESSIKMKNNSIW